MTVCPTNGPDKRTKLQGHKTGCSTRRKKKTFKCTTYDQHILAEDSLYSETTKNYDKAKNVDILIFFSSFPAPCIYEAVCDWHRVFDKSLQDGGSCFYLGREMATSASFCILFYFSFFCQLERLCFNTWTHTNSYKLRGSEVLLDDFAQEVLQSRTAVFCIFSIPTVNKEYSNDA